MQQHTCTVVLRLVDGAVARRELEALALRQNAARQPSVFDGLGIHFARGLVIEEPGGSPYSAWLVLETNFDSAEADRKIATETHLRQLAEERRDELRGLLSACATKGDSVADQLIAGLLPSTAEYQGHADREVTRIELEARIHQEAMICAGALPHGTSAAQVHRAVRQHLMRLQLPGLALDEAAPALPDATTRQRELGRPVQAWASHLRLLAGSVLAILGSTVKELFDTPYDLQGDAEGRGPDSEARLAACAVTEDHGVHNALTHLVPLKPGRMRQRALLGLHRYLDGVARDHFNPIGMLGGIPSIHFAKWLLIDEGRRLLFLSNYDGSWESYLGDFVDGAAAGLNAAWTCTEGYPRTHAIFFGGADDEERFKAWARAHQRPTQLFYSAYPRLSVAAINNATWLRHGLHAPALDAAALAEWQRRLT